VSACESESESGEKKRTITSMKLAVGINVQKITQHRECGHEGGRAGLFCNWCLNKLSVTATVTEIQVTMRHALSKCTRTPRQTRTSSVSMIPFRKKH
jgi:hypothetical protein